jgi:hypothetical protein
MGWDGDGDGDGDGRGWEGMGAAGLMRTGISGVLVRMSAYKGEGERWFYSRCHKRLLGSFNPCTA